MSVEEAKTKFSEYSEELNDLKELDINEMLRYLIKIGDTLPILHELERSATTLVPGCVSNAHVVVERGHDNKVCIRGSADAMVVKGFMAIIAESCRELTLDELVSDGYTIIAGFLKALDLNIILTPNRANAFGNVVLLVIEKGKELCNE